MRYFEHKGARVAVNQIGSGPPMIFVHCSSASHKEWLFAADHYKSTHTCIMPDLIGYGKTSGHLDNNGDAIECTDADVIAFLLDELEQPADIVAHSYGAVACLEAARHRPEKARSLFMIEPVAFHLLLGEEYADACEQAHRLGKGVASAEEAGDLNRAARIYMSYWIGFLKWTFSPRRFKDAVIRTVPKVAQEFRSIVKQRSDVTMLAKLDCPATLLKGAKSPLAAHAVVDILDQCLPDSSVSEIPKGGHMLPFTHPNDVFECLCEHMKRVDQRHPAT